MSFLLAVTFLTVIPLKRSAQYRHPAMGRAMLWFPAVGLLIGCATAGVLFGAGQVFPGILPPTIAVVFVVGLTGALHLDGLADTFDGLFGGRDRESRLRIMRDTGVGAYGTAAVACALLLKVGAVAALADARWLAGMAVRPYGEWPAAWFGRERWVPVAAVALAPVWGRWVMTLAAGIGPYARKDGGTGAFFVESITVFHAGMLGLIPFVLTVYLFDWQGAVAGAATGLVAGGLMLWWRRKIGGVTGDTMGALGEVSELAFLLALLLVLPLGKVIPY